MKNPYLIPFLKRFLILFVVAVSVMLLISEVSYLLQRDDISRDPMTVELVIPFGTAEKIAAGESSSTIPEEMIFVVGDILLVRNEDLEDHELGPLWIPAGKSASMVLDQENNFTYSCSFQSSRYFDLTVKSAITWKDRLQALWYGVPSTLMFLLVYSFVVKPIKINRVSAT
jgi:hypothetical protein